MTKGLLWTAAIAELRSMGLPLTAEVEGATEVTDTDFKPIELLGEIMKDLNFKEAALWTEGWGYQCLSCCNSSSVSVQAWTYS